MEDKKGRITIKEELLSKDQYLGVDTEINIFFDPNQKNICIRSTYVDNVEGMYWISKQRIDKNGRLCIPSYIRNAFPNASFLPAEKNGRIYILIIEH